MIRNNCNVLIIAALMQAVTNILLLAFAPFSRQMYCARNANQALQMTIDDDHGNEDSFIPVSLK